MAKTPFRIIVVGGSIAGLTLAHCLDQAGVDYVVLEKHGTIDSAPLGGFIAIMPTGARILTQLGLYAAVSRAGKPITVIHTGYPDGFEFSDYWPTFMAKRCVFNVWVPCFGGCDTNEFLLTDSASRFLFFAVRSYYPYYTLR